MSICPNCKSAIGKGATKCAKCGKQISEESAIGGTLNPGDMESSADSEDASGSIQLPSESSDSVISQVPQPRDRIADQTKTIRKDEGTIRGEPQESATIYFADSHVSGSDGGSEAKLKKIWDAAIGSSGKGSKKSLEHELPQASDSIFDRIAERTIADANTVATGHVDYQIRDKVGEGGMGIVYSALQIAVNRIVAVKTINAENAKNPRERRRFFYEASITADLDHPNIPPIYEFGIAGDGVVFYAMKLIAGSEWKNIIRKRSLAENLEIFSRVADAVAFAHSRNIIHRDIKPENVIVGNYGEVYVTDWGIAVNLSQTPVASIGGTPDYMAPEMAANRGNVVGKHSDIYLLGAVLFEIVTGKPPHAARNQQERLELARANLIAETDSTDPLLEVARTAMNTQPEDRYATVADLQSAVREILKHNDSIELAKRSEELVSEAVQSNNYETFNRAIFGFRDAIELWNENDAAKQGLQNARLAYGQCALDQGSFDVAMQTLDERNPKEATLYAKAKKSKLLSTQREQRIKRTRRIFAGVVASLLLLLSGALLVAYNSVNGQLTAQKTANKALEDASASDKLAKLSAEKAAESAKKEEETAKKNEALATENVAVLKKAAESAKEVNIRKEEANQAILAQTKAEAQAADTKRLAAVEREIEAVRAKARVELAALPQSFNLAISKIRQYDLQGSMELLDQIRNAKLSSMGEMSPSLTNWAFNRVSLLSNQDLPKQPLGEVKAIDFATNANVGVAGNKAGQVSLLRFENGQLKEQVKKQLGSSVNAVIVSPDGNSALLATESSVAMGQGSNGKTYELYSWNLKDGSEPTKVSETGNRSFQGFSYSPDGKTSLAGINQGLWVRSGSGTWNRVSKDSNVDIRGELKDISWLNASQAVVLARLNNTNHIHSINVTNGESMLLKLPTELQGRVNAMTTMASNRILLGLTDGSMESYLIQGTELSDRRQLTKHHRTPIESIRASGTGKYVSRSNEPVAHVWKTDSLGHLAHETYLTSAPSETARGNNVSNIAFVDSETAVTVDTLGNAVALGIERQKQRRLISREPANASEQTPAPVVGIHTQGKSSVAIAVDENGVVDLWNLQTGKSASAGNRWSYFGHTPGATLVDSQVDIDSGIIVTAASLREARRSYLADPNHFHEYCFWDYKTGNMLRRWSEQGFATSAPRISLVEPGKLLTQSESAKVIDYSAIARGGELAFPSNDSLASKRPRFSIANPKNKELVAMVNAAGAVLLWDKVNEIQNAFMLGKLGELPMRGAWSNDGKHFYIVVNNGSIFRCELVGNRLEKPRRLGIAKLEEGYLANSYHAIDFSIERRDEKDVLYCAVRLPTSTSLTSMAISDDGQTSEMKSSVEPGIQWFDSEQKKLTRNIGRVALNEKQEDTVLSASRIGSRFFVTTKREGVYNISPGTGESHLVGVAKFINSTSDRAGRTVWTLHSDGAVLRLDLSDTGISKWTPLAFTLPGAKRIEVSPDGSTLAVLTADHLRLVSAIDGAENQKLDAIVDFAWDPNSEKGMGAVKRDGSILTVGIDGVPALAPIRLDGATIKSVHFFNERWSDANQKPYRYILVQAESLAKENGDLHFVRLEGQAENEKKEPFIGKIPKEAELAVSPKDSVIATGETTGTIRIWFASPKYDSLGELYDLESERDAAIRRIAFVDEGDTLVTTDEKGRVYGWMSKDKRTSLNLHD